MDDQPSPLPVLLRHARKHIVRGIRLATFCATVTVALAEAGMAAVRDTWRESFPAEPVYAGSVNGLSAPVNGPSSEATSVMETTAVLRPSVWHAPERSATDAEP